MHCRDVASRAGGATPAAPAGYIFVTRGLLKTVKNEAELAGVLGHEIGHVTQKHILDVIQRSKQIAGAGKKLLDKGLHQGKELESDRLGVIFAARVGYDPSRLQDVSRPPASPQGQRSGSLQNASGFFQSALSRLIHCP